MSVLEKGGMDPQGDLVNCAGAYWIAPYIKCTGVHGNVNYYRAMAVSCNTYFQEMGRRAGKDEIIHVGKQFGLGSKTGIDLPYETAGLLPTPEWKKEISSIMVDSKYKRLFKELDQKYAALITNAKDEEEKRGNVVKLTNWSRIDEERRCFEKKHPEPEEEYPARPEPRGRSPVDWETLIPR